MDLGTIDHREPAVLPCKSKKQICAAEDHSLGTLSAIHEMARSVTVDPPSRPALSSMPKGEKESMSS
jgi:hypothetical protein